jgi:hypothetical protein
MLGFGLLIGLLFPFVVVLLGVPRDIALGPSYSVATLIAGLAVAEVNHLLARTVVGVRLPVSLLTPNIMYGTNDVMRCPVADHLVNG